MMESQAGHMLALLKVVWGYRFFFNNIHYLIQVDPSQRQRFNAVRKHLIGFTATAYEQLIELNAVKKIKTPNSTQMVVENAWYLWFSLIRLYDIVSAGAAPSERGFYRFAVDHIFSLLEPHYADSVKTGFYEYVRAKLG
jgi:hypothetical protein